MTGFALVHSRALNGLRAESVQVEVHLANGLPSFTLVGLAETEVKEARERVRSAIANAGLEFPNNKRITVNLAPADLPKDSGRFDLPIALGILAASGQIDAEQLKGHEFAGELSLSGQLRAVRGCLAMALATSTHAGADAVTIVLPMDSAREAALVPDARVVGVSHLLDVVARFQPAGASATAEPSDTWQVLQASSPAPRRQHARDMAEVKGQNGPKRALEIAAAGGHSVLMVGPPGAGKSMLAERFASILPPLSTQEALESAAVLSLAGSFKLDEWGQRPTIAPHHTASAVALVGGGSPPRPGEISRAHHSVLYLDEFPEFARASLEALREPLESGTITIARASQRAEFPARFQLVAAMNPCPCGYLGSKIKACRCSPDQVLRYQAKLSGPLLDRIDIHIEVQALAPAEVTQASAGESSEAMAERVAHARARSMARQGELNHRLSGSALETHITLDEAARKFLNTAAARLGWSARAVHRALRVARTIADLAGAQALQVTHVAEAIQYRRVLRASD